jgi:hypothetical protein
MEDFVRLLSTDEGDIYHITLSEDTILFSQDTLKIINGVKVVGIDLRRLVGSSPTGHDMLAAIEKVIADFFMEYDNVMIFYYCDFLNPIPHTKKTSMPPQEYRSNLFRLMFERYVSLHDIDDVHLSVITAKGIDDTYFFHLIYRECHAHLAPVISQDIKEGYSK